MVEKLFVGRRLRFDQLWIRSSVRHMLSLSLAALSLALLGASQWGAAAAACICALLAYSELVVPPPPRDAKLDAATRALLEDTDEPRAPAEPGARALVAALNAAPVVDDEAACAQQMREIVAAGHLSFRELEARPATLLRCSPHVDTEHGALWTRFTVQYNLYAGSVVALGSAAQREALYASQAPCNRIADFDGHPTALLFLLGDSDTHVPKAAAEAFCAALIERGASPARAQCTVLESGGWEGHVLRDAGAATAEALAFLQRTCAHAVECV